MTKARYKFWSRDELFQMCKKQAIEYDINLLILHEACYDQDWIPALQFNGCNFVQDDYHPFVPCLIHDWRWICFDYSKTWDIEFRENLIKFGYSKFKAQMYYLAVRTYGYFKYEFKWFKNKQ